MKRSNILILVIVAVLIALTATIALINRNATQSIGRPDALLVFSEDGLRRDYAIDELRAFPAVDAEKTISSGKHADESGVFTGVPLETILDDADAAWRDKYEEFIFTGEDGFKSSVFRSDVEKPENVLVVYAKDGEALKPSAEGGKGPLRIVVVSDAFGNRSAYLLRSVEAK
ncbi:MAG: molybdopterin-dependent oxidoreductase [Clostridiales Family XIII bacterium]|jgi:DMSO/TMAO reductase YedYZ molybdopterin-dependent catalytic subunit|nr:molybdopterin-dependent oxidoreductase [Clostridiales Family XIII bacterium]